MSYLTSHFAKGPAHKLNARHQQRQWARASFAILLVALMLLGARPESTQATSTTITQITTSPAGLSVGPSLNTDCSRIAFASNANLTGGNSDLSEEIFLYDTATAGFTQVTNATRGNSVSPAISGDGTRIAFASHSDLTGGNADLSEEIFLYDMATAAFTQITSAPAAFAASTNPSISTDGTRIAFGSHANLTGGNSDGNGEIFLFDTTTATFTQITNTTASYSEAPSISGDGTRIAFQSTANLTGGNSDGRQEIFLYDTVNAIFTQITSSNSGSSQFPSINGDGARIAFASDENLTGGNADGNREIFLFDGDTTALRQVTNSTGGLSGNASISSDGTRIAFASDVNLTGGNTDGNSEIFLFDTATANFTQLTDTAPGANSGASMSADGAYVAFNSSANVTGGNTDGSYEIFLATCSLPSSERPADLMVSKSATPDPVKTGENLTYTIRVRNLGPGPAINLVMNDPLPADTTFVSAGSSHGSMTTPPTGSVGTVTCDATRLANGDTLTVTLVVNVTARGKTTITNEASAGADCPDPNSSNDRAAVQTRIFGSRR